jgi:predicted  nucleic acid-binding Zn-ribbon protein
MKIRNKIKDLFDVIKYKRQKNTFENKYNSRNAEYIKVLEDYHELSIKCTNYENQIKDFKKDIKELKRTIEEDMTPKKKRG